MCVPRSNLLCCPVLPWLAGLLQEERRQQAIEKRMAAQLDPEALARHFMLPRDEEIRQVRWLCQWQAGPRQALELIARDLMGWVDMGGSGWCQAALRTPIGGSSAVCHSNMCGQGCASASFNL